MSNIDLRKYVVAKWGKWSETEGSFCADQLRLTNPEDGIALAGPLNVRVSITARNSLTTLGTSSVAQCEREAFGYDLQLAPGQVWAYPEPRAQQRLAQSTIERLAGATSASSSPTQPATETLQALEAAGLRLGTNAGFGLLIRVAGECSDPCAFDPCAPTTGQGCPSCGRSQCGCASRTRGGCACGRSPCACQTQGDGLPCGFAQRGGSSFYFPSACEPCTPGAMIGVPASTATALLVRPASGGTVRTRYFNGMFITREDLETDQRNARLKRALMNRALGQGVAWGFEVGLDGSAVCVAAGYGVDCCGNDVILAGPYRVDMEALVRDPAAAGALASGRAQGMSLLLEYHECPEEPRPVHGDPCSTDVSRCETSRVRETARLRLVPPRPVDDSGCIQIFLQEIERLKADAQVARYLAQSSAKAAATPAAQVPFTVVVSTVATVDGAQRTAGATGAMQPAISGGTTAEDDAGSFAPSQAQEVVTITLTFASGFTLVSGSPVAGSTGSGSVSNVTTTSTGVSFQVPYPALETAVVQTITPEVSYLFQNWSFRDAGGYTYSASGTEIDLTAMPRRQWTDSTWGSQHTPPLLLGSQDPAPAVLHVMIPPTAVSVAAPSASRFPCLTEACDPAVARFAVTPPWLHENPLQAGQAADPRVLALALTYAFIVGERARIQEADGAAADRTRLLLAEGLFLAVSDATFGNASESERATVLGAVERLLQCWCKSLLYPGPRCPCGPHGVVIGCARVEGGRITRVDAWGGRRWIVHYPLLAYWGQQFGLMPADAIASRLFDMICCIASLVGSQGTAGKTSFRSGSPARADVPGQPASATLPLGSAMLVFEGAQKLGAMLAAAGTRSVRSQTVSLGSFAMRLWNVANESLTGSASATSAPPQSLVDYVPEGFPSVHLLLPDPASVAAGASSTANPAGSLDAIVSTAIGLAPQGSSPPPLLRGFTASLAKQILSVAPVAAADNVQHTAADALASAGVKTIGDLLSRDPEALFKTALKGANADGLNGLIGGAEGTARLVATDVADMTAKFASQSRVTSRSDLTDPARASGLAKALAERMATVSGAVTQDMIGAAVRLAAGAS